MCGIAGIVGLGAAQQASVAEAMSARISHRGPDGQGQWLEDGAALTHRRLAIIDLSADGAQPIVSGCDRYVLIFNGEIYNYRELKEELRGLGENFRGNSDTEVLLAAWCRWGRGCLQRLNGMFAFAVWDRQKKALFAARDRFGEKPFYYLEHESRLYFASEVKAFKPVPGLRWEPNPEAVADFAAERISDHTDRCFYEGISQLRPGGWLSYCDGRVAKGTYWSLDETDPSGAVDDDQLRETMRDAVRIRLRADTPIGTLLSGGIDSSLVTCLVAELTGASRTYAFSTINSPPVAEAKGIDAVLARLPALVPIQDHPSAEQFWLDLPMILWHQEEPFADASMAAHFSLMRMARHRGIPVLLTGQGADEVFGGYESAFLQYLGSRVRWGTSAEIADAARSAIACCRPQLAKVAYHMLPPKFSSRIKRARIHRLAWLSPEFRVASAELDAAESHVEDPNTTYLKNLLRVRTLPGFLHYEDRNSMAFGIETRLPFLDHRLVELAFRVPANRRFEGGMPKARLRAVARQWVPAEIVNRRAKTGYPAPLAQWAREKARAIIEQIEGRDFRQCPILEYRTWSRQALAFLKGDDRCLHVFWRGYVLGRWYSDVLKQEQLRSCA
jgi:asparagine synthase (glutamine-hydrolysing)